MEFLGIVDFCRLKWQLFISEYMHYSYVNHTELTYLLEKVVIWGPRTRPLWPLGHLLARGSLLATPTAA